MLSAVSESIGERLAPLIPYGQQREYEARIGAAKGWLSRVVKGKIRHPDEDKIAALAKLLRVDFEWLYYGRLRPGQEPPAPYLQRAAWAYKTKSAAHDAAVADAHRLIRRPALKPGASDAEKRAYIVENFPWWPSYSDARHQLVAGLDPKVVALLDDVARMPPMPRDPGLGYWMKCIEWMQREEPVQAPEDDPSYVAKVHAAIRAANKHFNEELIASVQKGSLFSEDTFDPPKRGPG